MNNQRSGGCLITPGVVFSSLILGGGLFLLFAFSLWIGRPPTAPVGQVTAALVVIPAPTATGHPSPTPPENASTATPPSPGGELIAVGMYVEISGTNGAGLRLRVSPGLEFTPQFLGMEDEVFKVEDGPQEADGYVWWYLVAPFEPERRGWAVSNYLSPIQNP